MSQPVIGVTTYRDTTKDDLPAVILLEPYVTALIQAGGVPVLIPSDLPEAGWRTLYPHLAGVMFTGGGDLAIDVYGGASQPRVTELDSARDGLELALLHMLVEDGKPFLGICRGCQLTNVALGGTLYSHIADQLRGAIRHDYYPDIPRNYLAHDVRVEEGSRLAEILGEPTVRVNSLHHQGLDRLAEGLKAVAYAPDGLVEAVELSDHPFGLAVQWHPEWLTDQQPMRNLFRSFVQEAGK
jgi:putative glutamine amidotransferase